MISSLFNFTKTVVNTTVPYQPPVAYATLIGKTAWNYYANGKRKKEISLLNRRICILKKIESHPKMPQQRKGILAARIALYIQERDAKQREMKLANIAFWQLPSLFFPHPGSNVWNSTCCLAGRGLSMQHVAILTNRYSNEQLFAKVTAGCISLAGVTTALMQQTGVIESSPVTKTLSAIALAVNTAEVAIMAKNWLQQHYFPKPVKPAFAQATALAL